eukprot:8896016-Pyramimonas_sp.AAC.1
MTQHRQHTPALQHVVVFGALPLTHERGGPALGVESARLQGRCGPLRRPPQVRRQGAKGPRRRRGAPHLHDGLAERRG